MIIGILAILLVIGVPISYSIGIASLVTILQTVPAGHLRRHGRPAHLRGHEQVQPDRHSRSSSLAGNLMNQGGIAKRLVNFVMAILGKLPGALLVTNVGANALVRRHLRLRLRRRGRGRLDGPARARKSRAMTRPCAPPPTALPPPPAC